MMEREVVAVNAEDRFEAEILAGECFVGSTSKRLGKENVVERESYPEFVFHGGNGLINILGSLRGAVETAGRINNRH